MAAHNEAGRRAEQDACRYLQQQGLRLVERNYACNCGEIDLIMQDRDTLVFVEVRYRKNPRFGSAAESVDWRKQDKLSATAAHYLQTHPKAARQACRFDVIALSGQGAGDSQERHQQPNVDWIPNAFQA